MPLSVGDWSFVGNEQLKGWFPWPSVWQPEVGFGFKNFSGIYEFPLLALAGVLARFGASWSLAEKLIYFFPFAALSVVSPWLFARELLGSSRWALLSALIFSANTYILLVSNGGDLFIAMAEVLAPLVFLALLRSLNRASVRWALAGGLLLGLQSAYEVRVAYLTIILGAVYVAMLAVSDFRLHLIKLRLGLAGLAIIVFIGTQAYWLLPILSYPSNYGLPIANAPWIAFMRITHGITGLHPYWTGGVPNLFKTAPLNPMWFGFPLLAFVPLATRRIRLELLWLSAAALLAAFLIKQDNPPAGQVYDWMFAHFPGWFLFREASKLYFIVVLAFAVLVPYGIRHLLKVPINLRITRSMTRLAALAGIALVATLSLASILPLEKGELGYTTRPRPEPASFMALSGIVNSDPSYGAIGWLGGAYVIGAGEVAGHRYMLGSERHPVIELTGNAGDGQPSTASGDPFVRFCPAGDVPFCYLDKQLFPYLLRQSGVRYVVAPAGPGVGVFPTAPWTAEPSITYKPILSTLTGILGVPSLLGHGDEALAMWQLPISGGVVRVAPAIAVVEGPPAITTQALPALQALDVPVVYRWSSLGRVTGVDSHSIEVVPRISDSYTINFSSDFALIAQSSDHLLEIASSDVRGLLPRLSSSTRMSGWSLYGPVHLAAGANVVRATSGTQLGPIVSWSSLTADVLSRPNASDEPSQGLGAEQVKVTANGNASWIELRRAYDAGWQSNVDGSHFISQDFFNLFRSGGTTPIVISYTTLVWERVGVAFSAIWILFLIIACARLSSRPRLTKSTNIEGHFDRQLLDSVAGAAAVAGILLLLCAAVLQAVAWTGVPSSNPALMAWLGPLMKHDPYGVSEWYVACAMASLAIATILRFSRTIAIQWRPANAPKN